MAHSPRAAVDAGQRQGTRAGTAAVQLPRPGDVPKPIEPFRPLALEQRFGQAIPALLAQVAAGRPTAVVPHHGAGREADGPAALVQSPADVDVVTGRPESRVVPADRAQAVDPEGRIAAWDVLRFGIGSEHVVRATRGQGDELGGPAVAGWWEGSARRPPRFGGP